MYWRSPVPVKDEALAVLTDTCFLGFFRQFQYSTLNFATATSTFQFCGRYVTVTLCAIKFVILALSLHNPQYILYVGISSRQAHGCHRVMTPSGAKKGREKPFHYSLFSEYAFLGEFVVCHIVCASTAALSCTEPACFGTRRGRCRAEGNNRRDPLVLTDFMT